LKKAFDVAHSACHGAQSSIHWTYKKTGYYAVGLRSDVYDFDGIDKCGAFLRYLRSRLPHRPTTEWVEAILALGIRESFIHEQEASKILDVYEATAGFIGN
jgi:hypothetical protein